MILYVEESREEFPSKSMAKLQRYTISQTETFFAASLTTGNTSLSGTH